MASIFPWFTTQNKVANTTGGINNASGMSLGAVDNPIFQSYADLFDEVKFDGCSAYITCTDPIAPGANYTGLLMGSVIDRSMTTAEATPSVATAKNSASWFARVAVNNSIPRIRRSIWASDAQERYNFVDSDYTHDAQTGNTMLNAWVEAAGNVNFFKPVIRFGLQTVAAPAVAQTANFMVQVNFYFTFRNPKGAAASASSKLAAQMRLDGLSDEAKAAVIDDDELSLAQQDAIEPAPMG